MFIFAAIFIAGIVRKKSFAFPTQRYKDMYLNPVWMHSFET